MANKKPRRKCDQGNAAGTPSDVTADDGVPAPSGAREPPAAQHVRLAKAPFNIDGPDVVAVLTADKVTFFVNKGLLSLASKYFAEKMSCEDVYPDGLPCPSKSYAFYAILRFLYPIQSPIFKDLSECDSSDSLPYCMMALIHADAKALRMDYVCSLIRQAAEEIASSQAIPKSGMTAVRVYAVACALNLEYEFKLKAARSCLYVPLETDLRDALKHGYISEENIAALETYRTRCSEIVCDFLAINEEDAFPEGLPDVYASFVSCLQCCDAKAASESPMRAGAAHWWQDYVHRALELLHCAPLDQNIFYVSFVQKIFEQAKSCTSCSQVVHWKWCLIMPLVISTILERVSAIDIETFQEPELLFSGESTIKAEKAKAEAEANVSNGKKDQNQDKSEPQEEACDAGSKEVEEYKRTFKETVLELGKALEDINAVASTNGAELSVEDLARVMYNLTFK